MDGRTPASPAPLGEPLGAALGAALGEALGEALWRLILSLGTPLVRAEEITVLPSARTARRTFRLWMEDGRSLKGRTFPTAELAAVSRRIRESVGGTFFPPVLACDGAAMVEEWVEGSLLEAGKVDPALVREAGRQLGSLHCCPLPSLEGINFTPRGVAAWLERIRWNLGLLSDGGVVAPEFARSLEGLALAQRPDHLTIGIVHRDLTPENLVLNREGRLVSVDNGSLTVGSLEEDLCRVWYRWPMEEAELREFAPGYAEFRDPAAFRRPSVFWGIAVLTSSARVRLPVSPRDAAAVMERLLLFLAGCP